MKFGEFLIGRGTVNKTDVDEALASQDEAQDCLLQIAVQSGMLSKEQAQTIERESRSSGFDPKAQATRGIVGEVALRLGFLSHHELTSCEQIQRESRPSLGQILVQKQKLREETLWQELMAFGTNSETDFRQT